MIRLFPPDQRQRVLDRVTAAITSPKHLNKRRERSYPRVVKRARHNSYRVKKPGQHGTRHDAPATIKLINPLPGEKLTSQHYLKQADRKCEIFAGRRQRTAAWRGPRPACCRSGVRRRLGPCRGAW